MAGVQKTSGEAEGIDRLQTFFNQNIKLKSQWLDKIREDLDYDDLIESDAADLRNLLKNDCKLKNIAVTKILNAVRKVPESVMYQALHATKVSIVSPKEHEAAQKIEKESARINEAIANIVHIMETLNENSKTTSKNINDVFDKIVNNANKRRHILLAQLNKITTKKYNQLSDQKELFNRKMKELNDAYDETQAMMKDISMNPLKRKTKVLSKSKQLLDQKITLNPATNEKIHVRLDVESVNNIISKLGVVQDGFGALPPTVTVDKITKRSAKIIITRNKDEQECTAHELQYVNADQDVQEEEKLDWKCIAIQNNNETVEYEITSLNVWSTRYLVRAKSKNNIAFGMYSKCVSYVYKGKSEEDTNYKSYTKDTFVKIKYNISASRLSFYQHNNQLYTMILPTDINDITHWYPCVSLRDKDDICNISTTVVVE